jgi:putative transposase
LPSWRQAIVLVQPATVLRWHRAGFRLFWRRRSRSHKTVLLRDRDDKFGPAFDRAAQGVGAKVIRTAVRAPNMNSVAERFVGSARREVLDHVMLLDDQHLASLLRQYQRYFNECRPHQRLGQRVPVPPAIAADPTRPIVVTNVLGGLHVDCRRAA